MSGGVWLTFFFAFGADPSPLFSPFFPSCWQVVDFFSFFGSYHSVTSAWTNPRLFRPILALWLFPLPLPFYVCLRVLCLYGSFFSFFSGGLSLIDPPFLCFATCSVPVLIFFHSHPLLRCPPFLVGFIASGFSRIRQN